MTDRDALATPTPAQPYAVRVWCRDCFGIDPQGCFNGGDEVCEFETSEERDRYIAYIERDGVPWETELVTDERKP